MARPSFPKRSGRPKPTCLYVRRAYGKDAARHRPAAIGYERTSDKDTARWQPTEARRQTHSSNKDAARIALQRPEGGLHPLEGAELSEANLAQALAALADVGRKVLRLVGVAADGEHVTA